MESTSIMMSSKFPKSKENGVSMILIVFCFLSMTIHSQNTCTPSSANDKIFVGSSSLGFGMLKPGVNTFSMATGIIESLTQSSTYNQSKLQIAHSFRNFASSQTSSLYEMNDFSFHSVLVSATQIKFLFLWNELITTNVTISLSIQFLLVYEREEFLMGSFVIDSVEFLISGLNRTETNYSRDLKFKDFNALTSLPGQSSSISVNLFIVGIRYLGSGINIRLKNEVYSVNSSQLGFTIQRNASSQMGLYLMHVSYVIFDKTYLSSQYSIFFSWSELAAQSKIDFWIKGVKQVNFDEFSTGDVDMSEIYLYKINRLKCTQACSGCIDLPSCQKMQGIAVNDSECVVCGTGTFFNSQTLKCQAQSTCKSNQTLNGTQCICKTGFVKINSQCAQCPQNTTYNSTTQKCDTKCDQNSTLSTNNQCICKQGFSIIDGKCAKCAGNYYYDSINKKCLLTCSVVEVYNTATQACDCISGFYKISGMCGKCSSGFVYDNVTQSCLYKCATNQVFVNNTCQCLEGFVIISGSCSKCPSGTFYNSLLRNCTASCTGNRKILNGKCVCNDGTYEIGAQCGTCPSGSTYNSSSKTCFIATNCKSNEVLVNGACYCYGPYVNTVCQPCSSNLVWNATSQECILKCPSNSLYNSIYKACVCNAGFYVIGQTCDVCPTSTVYDFATRSCQSGQNCTKQNEVYYLGLCICNAGYFRIGSNCSTCPSGTVYNETIYDCQTLCGQNQIYNSTSQTCQCNQSAGYYKINGLCQLCPSGTTYNKTSLKCENICPTGQVFESNKCSCPTGYYLIGSTCGLCDVGTVYNSTNLKCDKACPDANGYYQNGKCYCYPPYVVVNVNSCQQCPSDSTYDLSTLSCKSSTPSNTNVTCNSTTQIKKLNTTTGLYYCACDQSQKYYLVYDRCATCQMFTKYNPDTKSCELDISLLTSTSVYYFQGGMSVGNSTASMLTNGSCLSKENKVLVNGQCKCVSTAIKLGTFCAVCPSNSAPNLQQTLCQCKTGFTLSKTDYTCKIASTTVQQTTGQCQNNEILSKNECVCVQDYYKINGTCTKCPTLTLFNGTTCVCQYGYYAQSLGLFSIPTSCIKCHSSCATCTGPSYVECLSCSNISSFLTNGQCVEQTCSIGYYFQNYSSGAGQCQKCSAYCKSCSSSIQCKQCIDGFAIYAHALTPSLTVKVCSEICGDGKRFERNCDDGNTVSGDGCTKDCQVESGWTCVGSTTAERDLCSLIVPTPKSIISVMNATIQKGLITQNIRLSYIPDYFLKTQCSLCSNLFKITVTQAKIIPDSIKIAFFQKSKYQFSIEFKFSDILAIPIFKFGIQINPEYRQYFTEWDMAQWYEVEVNSALLSKKSEDFLLRTEDII